MLILTLFLSLLSLSASAEYTSEQFQQSDGFKQYKQSTFESVSQEEFKKWKQSAEQGNAHAQCRLGQFYSVGQGVLEDKAEAAKWYRKAAEQDNLIAQSMLGQFYHYGFGVVKDYSEALKWYRKAAMQGDSPTQFTLGRCYYVGEGVTKDLVEAYAYFSLAAITLEHSSGTRDFVAKEMTPSQIEAGQKRSKELQKEIEAKIAAKGEKK